MKAITLWAPWGTLIMLGTKTYETRSWPCPPKLIGQRVAFHQAARRPSKVWDDDPLRVGDYVVDCVPLDPPSWCLSRPSAQEWGSIDLPLGAVLGTGIIAASYPIYDWRNDGPPPRPFIARRASGHLAVFETDNRITDIDDQIPYGDFRPGRYAWEIIGPEPFDKPIPAKGRQGWWRWEP